MLELQNEVRDARSRSRRTHRRREAARTPRDRSRSPPRTTPRGSRSFAANASSARKSSFPPCKASSASPPARSRTSRPSSKTSAGSAANSKTASAPPPKAASIWKPNSPPPASAWKRPKTNRAACNRESEAIVRREQDIVASAQRTAHRTRRRAPRQAVRRGAAEADGSPPIGTPRRSIRRETEIESFDQRIEAAQRENARLSEECETHRAEVGRPASGNRTPAPPAAPSCSKRSKRGDRARRRPPRPLEGHRAKRPRGSRLHQARPPPRKPRHHHSGTPSDRSIHLRAGRPRAAHQHRLAEGPASAAAAARSIVDRARSQTRTRSDDNANRRALDGTDDDHRYSPAK